ncbi:hypothetical protein ACIHFE_14125 [Streptomyces sp. NPDC052396]|uniref:hypothetical protein n=1 Tax=Streptomyces sp. NPDC052396 TaxID=3365689 RepID=UPI0037D56DCD
MIQTMQFHGEAPVMELWGPDEAGQGWERLQGITAPSGAVATQESTELAQQSRRTSAQAERLRDRRYQLLASALAQTMRTGLGDADLRAMEQLAETVEEETVRRIGQWLAAAKSS